MVLRSKNKPPLPLARSPIQLRSRRRSLEPIASSVATQSPPGQTAKPNHTREVRRSAEVLPTYQTMSCQITALAKMVHQELGVKPEDTVSGGGRSTVVFERGRFYNEYSAKRNERLKRKKSEVNMDKSDDENGGIDDGVRIDASTKRDTTGAAEDSSRYSLRRVTSKENKKPPLSLSAAVAVDVEDAKVSVRRRARKAY
ncbi:uncharacterized protein LOC127256994 [Andrographis paniculata]|uniref:uncharacterized protein LOC127256994 n=1 Tax=Andrographis paniculata TaxID=175694 RepID=UPI0021E72602|nr:uncharacterized protein LOC127256994 [Andrographis paniculata]